MVALVSDVTRLKGVYRVKDYVKVYVLYSTVYEHDSVNISENAQIPKNTSPACDDGWMNWSFIIILYWQLELTAACS